MSGCDGFLLGECPMPGLAGRTVSDFWQWAYSDVLSNRNRSIFAEFVVGAALGVVDEPRVEWDSADHCYQGRKIEVKSSADCQSWYQEKPSTVKFSIRKAAAWDRSTGKYVGERTRCADLYVFCHYPEQDPVKAKTHVIDAQTWDFYPVLTAILNREFGDMKSLSLTAVRRVALRYPLDGLKAAVDGLLAVGRAE